MRILFLLASLTITILCQAVPPIDWQYTPTYTPTLSYGERIFIPMEFGYAAALDLSGLHELADKPILQIEIVSSDWPRGIDLSSLVQRRYDEVLGHLAIADEHAIRSIVQTACTSEADAGKLFHGVVITYIPTPSADRAKRERIMLEALLDGATLTAARYTPRHVPLMEVDSLEVTTTRYYKSDGTVTEVVHAPIPYEGAYPAGSMRIVYSPDSTFYRIMERNSHWDKMMIAADLTGSMYPYTAQILTWLQLQDHTDGVKRFAFFNDGDNKPDAEKVIGRTGGIYIGDYSEYQEVRGLALKTMSMGGGGDAPENNIEALIEGIDGCHDCGDIIMVADNNAPIKDKILTSEINRPVHIVLCGSFAGYINTDYLDLARSTGGSVHTIEKDITRLADMSEGEQIELSGMTYVITGGRFQLLTRV